MTSSERERGGLFEWGGRGAREMYRWKQGIDVDSEESSLRTLSKQPFLDKRRCESRAHEVGESMHGLLSKRALRRNEGGAMLQIRKVKGVP